jgi:hypothetical protein
MKLLKWFMGLFRKKTEDNSFYDVRAEHEQIARELDEWRKNEILRSLQALKNTEEFKREILYDEEAQKNHYLQSLEYRNRIISMYRDGLEDIETYLNEHASEHDGYRIRLDVSEIIRDVERAVDKAGEL